MPRSSCAEGIGSVRSLVVIMVGVVAPSLSDFAVRAGVTPCLSVPRAPPLPTRLGWMEKALKIAMEFGNFDSFDRYRIYTGIYHRRGTNRNSRSSVLMYSSLYYCCSSIRVLS